MKRSKFLKILGISAVAAPTAVEAIAKADHTKPKSTCPADWQGLPEQDSLGCLDVDNIDGCSLHEGDRVLMVGQECKDYIGEVRRIAFARPDDLLLDQATRENIKASYRNPIQIPNL